MLFTPSERRLLALIACLLGSGYLVTGLCHCKLLPAKLCGRPNDLVMTSRGELAPTVIDRTDTATGSGAAGAVSGSLDTIATPATMDSVAEMGAGLIPNRTADAPPPFVGGYLDINRADSSALVALPGIGPALASRILERRRQRPFRSLEDLDEVKGIGPSKLKQLAGYVVILPADSQ